MEETKINQYNENGQRDGVWKYYNENGKLRKIEYLDD